MSKEILLGYLADAKKECRNTAVLHAIINQLISIVEEHYNKPQQVTMQCPPAIIELANKMEPQIDILADQKEEIDELKSKLQIIHQEKQIIIIENKRVDEVNKNLQKDKLALIEQKNKISEMFEAANKKHQELQLNYNKMNEDYVHLQRSHNHLKETHKGQKVQYNLLQQGYNEVAEERDLLQEQLLSAKEQLDRAANDWNKVNDDLVAHNLKLHAENIELAEQLDKTLKENFKLRQAMLTPESFKVVENSTLEGMKTRHNNLEQEKIKFLEDISQLVADKEVLQESLNRMTEKYDTLRKECLGLQQTINNLLGISPIKNPKDSITITTHDGRQKEIY